MADEGTFGSDLEHLTVAQLRERAAEFEIPGRSAMNKSDLIAALGAAAPAPVEASMHDEGPAPEDSAAPPESSNVLAHVPMPDRIEPKARPEFESPDMDTDAMGLDKRREVVGKSYGASFLRQLTLYGIFVFVTACILFGLKTLADKLDEPPAKIEAKAPWTHTQVTPPPIDFPDYGKPQL